MMRFAVRQKTGLTRPITCRVTTVAFCLTLALASLLASRLEARSHAAEPPPPHIPIVHATTLSGDAVDLPQALNGKTGILILGFSQHSRDQVTPWGKRLAADYLAAPDILYFEMPILAAVPRLLRPMVLHSLKSSVPDRAQPHFLPVTENESQWRTIAHYTADHADDAYLLIVDQAGRVLWQTQGTPTDATYATLKHQVDTLRSHI